MMVIKIIGLAFISVVLFMLLGYRLGNKSVLGLINRLGFRVFCGKPVRDMAFIRKTNRAIVGFITVPKVLYAPIFVGDSFEFKYRDYRGNIGGTGEAVVDTSKIGNLVRTFSMNPETGIFADLTILKGRIRTVMYKGNVSDFSSLVRYAKSELRKVSPVVLLHDGVKERKFEFVFATELFVEEEQKFSASSREEFLRSLRKRAFYDTSKNTDSNILILNGYTEIDSLFIVLREV